MARLVDATSRSRSSGPNDPSSQLTKLQTQRLQEWKMAGAIVGVARSVEEALQILGFAEPDKQVRP